MRVLLLQPDDDSELRVPSIRMVNRLFVAWEFSSTEAIQTDVAVSWLSFWCSVLSVGTELTQMVMKGALSIF
jgi:hypothetical protein